jgi:hypothetical protein
MDTLCLIPVLPLKEGDDFDATSVVSVRIIQTEIRSGPALLVSNVRPPSQEELVDEEFVECLVMVFVDLTAKASS